MSIEHHAHITERGTLPYLFGCPEDKQLFAPLVVFLHGGRDRGDDPGKLLSWGFPRRVAETKSLPYYFLALQIPLDATWPEWRNELFDLIDQLATCHPIDLDRVILTGFSLGSAGVWEIGIEHAARFAGLVVVSGQPPSALAESGLARLRDTPVWVFHGEQDEAIPVAGVVAAVKALQELNAPVNFTPLPNADHFIADEVYADPALQEWIVGRPRRAESAVRLLG